VYADVARERAQAYARAFGQSYHYARSQESESGEDQYASHS